MATQKTVDPALEAVRRRARRLRRRVEPARAGDRFGLGVLAALLIDLAGASLLVIRHDFPPTFFLLLGPLSLAAAAEVFYGTGVALIVAGCSRRWSLLWGIVSTQLGLFALAFVWPLIVGPVRFLPL